MKKYSLFIILSLSFLMCFSVSAQSTHSYFDLLSAQSGVLISKPYRTQAEINADPYGGPGATVYDAKEDAAKFTIPSGDGTRDASIPLKDQFRPRIPPQAMTSGNLLIYYETKHGPNFAANGAVYGLATHKSFTINKDGKGTAIQQRHRYSQVDRPYVARVDVKVYGGGKGYQTGGFDSLVPQVGEFNVLPNVWVRNWMFLDFDNKKFSFFIGDEHRPIVAIHDNVNLDYTKAFPGSLLDMFIVKWNTSSKGDAGAPPLNTWTRNVVLLKNVSDVRSLVSQGDSGGSGEPLPTPQPQPVPPVQPPTPQPVPPVPEPTPQPEPQPQDGDIGVAPLNAGVAALDKATGLGYIMYSQENLFTRFASAAPHYLNSNHFIAVKNISDEWHYDNNNRLVKFQPQPTDVLVASVDFDRDSIASLRGENSEENGITKGYARGDLSFVANRFQGKNNEGEFTVSGTSFKRNLDRDDILVGPLNDSVAAIDEATGLGYIMYSQESVFTRFPSRSPIKANSDHFIAVKNISGRWHYDNNSRLVGFTPRPSDVLVASVDFGRDIIASLLGVNSNENGIAKGYASGDLSFVANLFKGRNNKGEFTLIGTFFRRNSTGNIGPKALASAAYSVTLDGSGSSDLDGRISSYSWRQVSGPSVKKPSGFNSSKASFEAPRDNTELVFELTVKDNEGASSKKRVTVTISTK